MQTKLTSISKEDLLLQISKLKAENTLLRKQSVEIGKLNAYIVELEEKLKKARVARKDAKQLDKAKKKIRNQREQIQILYKKLNGKISDPMEFEFKPPYVV